MRTLFVAMDSTQAIGYTSRTTATPEMLSCAKVSPATSATSAGGNELSNIYLIHFLLRTLAQQNGKPEEDYTRPISLVPDRPGHDRRYAVGVSPLVQDSLWGSAREFETLLAVTVSWVRGGTGEIAT